MGKIKIATDWLDVCSSCHMSLLDIDERIVDLIQDKGCAGFQGDRRFCLFGESPVYAGGEKDIPGLDRRGERVDSRRTERSLNINNKGMGVEKRRGGVLWRGEKPAVDSRPIQDKKDQEHHDEKEPLLGRKRPVSSLVS